MTKRLLFWLLCTAAFALVVACVVFDVVDFAYFHAFDNFQLAGAVFGVSFTLVGALVVWRRPDNRIGWIYLAIGVLMPANSLMSLYYAHSVISGWPGGQWAAWASNWIPLAVFPTGLMLFAFLLFPNGRLPSPRWRWLVAATIALDAALLATTMMDPTPIDVTSGFPKVANVTAAGAKHDVAGLLYLVGIVLIAVTIAGLLVRGRRAATQERQQMKLLAYAAALTMAALCVGTIVSLRVPVGHTFWQIPMILGFGIAVPAAFGLAIFKHGLYEIDRVISRTLSYALLTGLLVGVFAGLVLLTTRVLPFSSPVGVAASTLAALALFNPLRGRIQRGVDRRFNRAHYDAEATVAAFGVRLRDAVDPETVLSELAAAAGGSLQPTHVSVWVKP